MKRDHGDADCSDDRDGQKDERGERDHRDAENPNHFRQTEKAVIEVEKDGEPDDGKFQKD